METVLFHGTFSADGIGIQGPDARADRDSRECTPWENYQLTKESPQLAVELDPEAEGAEGLLMRADEKVEILYRKEKELKAPVKEGTTVGEICYLVDGEIWRRERLYAAWTVEAVDLSWCGRQILKRFLVAFP